MSETAQHFRPAPERETESERITFRGYATGFVLAAVLTTLAFWLVMDRHIADTNARIVVLLALALVQIVVHMRYFLHMNGRSENGWNLLALIFTAILVFILLTGSTWIMYHLDRNLMPITAAQSRNLP